MRPQDRVDSVCPATREDTRAVADTGGGGPQGLQAPFEGLQLALDPFLDPEDPAEPAQVVQGIVDGDRRTWTAADAGFTEHVAGDAVFSQHFRRDLAGAEAVTPAGKDEIGPGIEDGFQAHLLSGQVGNTRQALTQRRSDLLAGGDAAVADQALVEIKEQEQLGDIDIVGDDPCRRPLVADRLAAHVDRDGSAVLLADVAGAGGPGRDGGWRGGCHPRQAPAVP